ncbi:MAG: sulfite exporter TauE/SafE family protein [Myxococcales bacterium]|nr:sulfite exporter TauE/SafE family protein [Deltaproteobacteria bacterium]NND30896.1 sulfite exporter TauE/SafE family protein [Myxococcales bacterium]MBT8480404.1 sulfite exporter TauE/SafE family protein [Deltaproteobacteria bacterium]NNK07581.1 sulfite exporter TauE/SafE family protein [Myxococcales bacterium]NNK44800.1 sulfite exporter TauE/SafE family protein [Myxococcales bacterium]
MEALAHITTPEFAIAFFVSFLAAALQSTVGFGFALLSVPVLSLLNPLFAPVPQLLVVFPLTLAIVFRERHAVEVKSTLWIFAGRLPGALVGVALLKTLSGAALDLLMSSMVIVGVTLVISRGTFRRTPAREFGAGVASGTMAMVSAIGGPPIALLYRNDSGPTVRANLGFVFAIGLCITISVRALAGEVSWAEVLIGAALLPAVALGLRVSQVLIPRVDGARLRNAIVVVAAAAALLLFTRGAFNW